MLERVLKSKFALAIAGILILPAVYYTGYAFYEKRQIDQEVLLLEDQIKAVEGRNKEILELISYYKTTEYKERQARSILGLQKPGEFVVALPPRPNPGETGGEESTAKISNPRLWWNYFFEP